LLDREIVLDLGDEILDELVERGRGLRMCIFEPTEAHIDPAPARGDELDEEREIVDASLALCEELALDPLEASDRLVEEASDLGNVPRDRKHFLAKSAAERELDLSGDCGADLCCGRSERFDLRS